MLPFLYVLFRQAVPFCRAGLPFTESAHAQEAFRLRSDDASFTETGEKSVQRRKFQTEGVQQLDGLFSSLSERSVVAPEPESFLRMRRFCESSANVRQS